mmetsp:Transcript_106703/g.334710  ORF Transcript_106703/g.334710 Transcript_106703/m.334710 type:complete len:248 (+) Transcript_106703:355-1098(+)
MCLLVRVRPERICVFPGDHAGLELGQLLVDVFGLVEELLRHHELLGVGPAHLRRGLSDVVEDGQLVADGAKLWHLEHRELKERRGGLHRLPVLRAGPLPVQPAVLQGEGDGRALRPELEVRELDRPLRDVPARSPPRRRPLEASECKSHSCTGCQSAGRWGGGRRSLQGGRAPRDAGAQEPGRGREAADGEEGACAEGRGAQRQAPSGAEEEGAEAGRGAARHSGRRQSLPTQSMEKGGVGPGRACA